MSIALYLLLALLCGYAIFRLYLLVEKSSRQADEGRQSIVARLLQRLIAIATRFTRAVTGSAEQERRIRARYEELKAKRLAREEAERREQEKNEREGTGE